MKPRHTSTNGLPSLCYRLGTCVCLATLGGIALLINAACGPSDSDVKDPVVIEIGEQVIRLSELQAQVDFWQATGNALPRDKAAFVERYVERLVALEKAHALGLDQDMELRRQWENLLIGRLQQTELEKQLIGLQVSDEELESYYQDQIESYTTPAQVRLALLFLKVTEKMSAEECDTIRLRLEEARTLAKELPAETRGFGSLAMRYSEEATSRFKGGDIGWLQAGKERYRWPEAVVQAGFAMKEQGSISQVIDCDEGLYLLKKLDAREAIVRPLDERLRANLRNKLFMEKRATEAAQIKQAWEEDLEMTLHEDVLADLELSPALENSEASETFTLVP